MKRTEEDALLSWLKGLVLVAQQTHAKVKSDYAEGVLYGIKQAHDIVCRNIEDSRAARRKK